MFGLIASACVFHHAKLLLSFVQLLCHNVANGVVCVVSSSHTSFSIVWFARYDENVVESIQVYNKHHYRPLISGQI